MIVDPFDAALSDFIDSLPEFSEDARELLDSSVPFRGLGDLPELAEFATALRAIEPPRPSSEWLAASKARIMAAPLPAGARRSVLSQLRGMLPSLADLKPSLPSLPAMPALTSPSLFGRAAVALAVVVAVGSIAYSEHALTPPGPSADQPAAAAQTAITLAEREVDLLPRESAAPESQVAGVYIKGTPKDVVMLAKYFADAELAIDKAPADQQAQLQAKLDSVVNAVRFDGSVDAVSGGSVTVSGVPVAVDPSNAAQLQVGQTVSVVVNVSRGGQLHAVQLAPTSPGRGSPPRSSPPGGPTSGPDQRASAGGNDSGSAGPSASAPSVSAPAPSASSDPDRADQSANSKDKDNGASAANDSDGNSAANESGKGAAATKRASASGKAEPDSGKSASDGAKATSNTTTTAEKSAHDATTSAAHGSPNGENVENAPNVVSNAGSGASSAAGTLAGARSLTSAAGAAVTGNGSVAADTADGSSGANSSHGAPGAPGVPGTSGNAAATAAGNASTFGSQGNGDQDTGSKSN
ncbi:MAG: hypothetical protein JO247_08380, partial [Chloroflexi bacterium]|nr:hypothetical protein [Chloroflexota bacterium]